MRRIPCWRPTLLAATVVTAVVVVPGLASAAIPDAAGLIHACSQRGTGRLRVVDTPASCRPDEEAISWRQQGRPGPGIVAHVRESGPVTFPGDAPIDLPLQQFRGPASPVEFRIMSFEPGAPVQHTLTISVTEFACYVGDPGAVQTVSVDVIGWK